ncbi:hypothetical protein ACHAP6_001971 [Verticillium nonalfalfae]|uniref:Autophagy protein 5 n=2 Tax=Verticillium TaxID=1036719 RepID=C9S6C9_VERA1|nr:autophagy protein [Verticillium alfalfae VaMs.102]EEY14441.1 autophagy protein [Verticillium alfalfae VaMs.102]
MASLAETLWSQTVPLHITHPSQPNNPFITNLPRFSYLALLLPRLSAFFHDADADTPISSFHHEDLLLRNLPLGLLVDLYSPPLPWRLTVGDGPSWDMADTFLNGVKEADFTRYGTAKRIMSLSKADTSTLWHAVQDNDHAAFARISAHLLDAPTPLRNIPLRLYIPSTAGAFRVLQAPVPPRHPATPRQPQRLGHVLRALLPALFPSSRDPVLAAVVLHGAHVPFSAPVEDLMREAAYPDGWLCLIVVPL